MTQRETLRHITAWLSDLANLTAGTQPLLDARAKLGAYASLLAERFPPSAFNRASLEAVARSCRFFPAYAEVATPLAAWWAENRPKPPGLAPPVPAPGRPPPTAAEEAYVAHVVTGLAAELRSPAKPTPERPLARPLSEGDLAQAYRASNAVDPRSLPKEKTYG